MTASSRPSTNVPFGSIRRLFNDGAAALLDALTSRQHLNPHATLAEALDLVADAQGIRRGDLRQAIRKTGFSENATVGRLRRVDLIRVSRAAARLLVQSE